MRTPSRFKGSLPELEPVCGYSQTATPSRLCLNEFETEWFVKTINTTGGPVDVWAVDGVDEKDLVESPGRPLVTATGHAITPTRLSRARVDPARLLPRGQPNTRTETDLIAMSSLAQPVRGSQHLSVRLEPIGDIAKNFRDG